jgi:DNA invertase Pin-like site-specific DNA recombinase
VTVGYARTSTSDQAAGLAAQARELKAAGAERIFGEQVSSTAKRAKLAECLAFLREGDVLTVTKPDRLARSAAELLSIEADLSKRGIGLVVVSMGGERLDTRNPTSKLMLTILAGVATWEREIMLERQREASPGRRPPANTRADPSASTRRRSGSCWPSWDPRRSPSASASLGVRSTACSRE